MPAVLYEKKGHIAYVTLNRPEAMNAVNREMSEELEDLWYQFDADDEAWVAILTGAGDRAFCAGADLRQMAAGGRPAYRPTHSLGHGIDVFKPIIAGINGYCLAAGIDMVLPCDIRVAAEHATFGMTMTRWGVMASTGASQLPRSIHWCHAMEMILTAERIDAQEAYRIGLVNKVVPLGQLIPTCEAYAEKILLNSPMAVRLSKEAAIRGRETTMQESLNIGFSLQRYNRTTEDAKEGPRAFAEKRTPNWTGR
ncbi:MAG: enoyl-CoA hydratase/isomerase family protein [Chloroflexi bacterium]|nr:enoyl-CoA hydratase/isomerase family protein [Chloroflexota bacterium]